eukprot:scaffold372034_cov36-Prasinocladus_malaysianus.AAC.1
MKSLIERFARLDHSRREFCRDACKLGKARMDDFHSPQVLPEKKVNLTISSFWDAQAADCFNGKVNLFEKFK